MNREETAVMFFEDAFPTMGIIFGTFIFRQDPPPHLADWHAHGIHLPNFDSHIGEMVLVVDVLKLVAAAGDSMNDAEYTMYLVYWKTLLSLMLIEESEMIVEGVKNPRKNCPDIIQKRTEEKATELGMAKWW